MCEPMPEVNGSIDCTAAASMHILPVSPVRGGTHLYRVYAMMLSPKSSSCALIVPLLSSPSSVSLKVGARCSLIDVEGIAESISPMDSCAGRFRRHASCASKSCCQ